MSLETIYTPRNKKSVFVIAGGKKPAVSFQKMIFTREQLSSLITTEELAYLEDEAREYWGSLDLFSSLYSLFSEGEPLILYTAEGGHCDTCVKMFLKYGQGQRSNFDEIVDIRTCMDNYDGNINEVVKKIERLMEIMFPQGLYRFQHCLGIMADQRGSFTWQRYQDHNFLPCASPWYHVHLTNNNSAVISLIATQSSDAYSEERVEYYRQQIREGKRLGCIVYSMPMVSNYAIILDGHHRVLASMLEGVFPDCLLITEPYYRVVTYKGEAVLNLETGNITKKNPGIRNLSEDILEVLRKNVEVEYTKASKLISEKEKLEYYKYYREVTKKGGASFPEKYEIAAKDMISRCNL